MIILTYFYDFPNVYLKGNVHNNFVILSLLIGASASHSEIFTIINCRSCFIQGKTKNSIIDLINSEFSIPKEHFKRVQLSFGKT